VQQAQARQGPQRIRQGDRIGPGLGKHKTSFETARLVFDDPFALSLPERILEGDERWQTLGMISGVMVVVAHTYRQEGDDLVNRIISARKATATERTAYAEGHEASS
jgi:uncharacterized DUF497 family protein